MPVLSRLVLASLDPWMPFHVLREAAREVGISGLHLSSRQFHDATPGLRVAGVDAPPLTAESRDEWADQVEDIENRLDAAAQVGATLSLEAGPPIPVIHGFLVQAVKHLAPRARDGNVTLLLRNRYATRLEQPMDFHRVIVESRAEPIMLDVDVAQFHRACVHPCDPVRAFEGRVESVRLSNLRAQRHVSLADGEINVRALLSDLRATDYEGPLVLLLGADESALERLRDDRRWIESVLG